MTFEQLRIFLAVADHLHFTRAAEALHLTQPAVSSAIAALEEERQVRLFHRLGRRIALTEAGVLLIGEARVILQRVRHAEQMLDELSGLQRGSLTVAASETVGSWWLPPRLTRFASAYPGLSVALTIGNTAGVVADVLSGAADLGIVEGRVEDARLSQTILVRDELVLVVGPGHRWWSRDVVRVSEVADSPWLMRESGSGTREAFLDVLRQADFDERRLTVRMILPSGAAIRAALAEGTCAAIVSRHVVADALKAGRLHAPRFEMPLRHFVLIRHLDRTPGAAERAFTNYLARPEIDG